MWLYLGRKEAERDREKACDLHSSCFRRGSRSSGGNVRRLPLEGHIVMKYDKLIVGFYNDWIGLIFNLKISDILTRSIGFRPCSVGHVVNKWLGNWGEG